VPLIGLAAVSLAACGGGSEASDTAEGTEVVESGSWDDVVAQAKKEGAVTYYSDQNQINLELFEKAFETEYPEIDLTFVRGLPQDLGPRLELEFSSGSGEADVFTTADLLWGETAYEAGNLVPVTGPMFEAEEFNADSYLIEDTYFVSHAMTGGLAWNTDLYPEGLKDFDDLLDPSLAGGKIGVIEASNSSLVDFYVSLEEAFGEEYVEKLAAQEPRVYSGGTAIIEALSSGEIAATSYGSPTIKASIEAGAPLDWTLTEEPGWGVLFRTHVLKTAPHPAAAQVLANFALMPEGQKALGRDYVSVIPGAEGSLDKNIDDLRPQDPELLTADFVAEYQQKWRGLFQ
jgi:iron(III) transport system substrate-binding protein